MKRALVMILLASCSAGEAPPGSAEEPLAGPYCINDVAISPGTVHFTGPRWLLDSAEAAGPMTMNTNVGVFLQPVWASSNTVAPNAGEIAKTVGYSFSERYDYIAVSSISPALGQSWRLEAYAAYQPTTWSVRDASCGALLGTGASYAPAGIYYQTVNAYHAALPGMEVRAFADGCDDGLVCALDLPQEDGGAPRRPRLRGNGFYPTGINPLLLGTFGRVSRGIR